MERVDTTGAGKLVGEVAAYLSLAILSLLMRSLASDIFEKTYCVARYPTPSAPNPMAKLVRFRRTQRRVADIIVGYALAHDRLYMVRRIREGSEVSCMVLIDRMFTKHGARNGDSGDGPAGTSQL